MRSFGIIPLLLASILALVPWASALTYHGADFSSLVNLEESGLVYKDASSRKDATFETILHNHGTNLARIRVWTSTNSSEYSLNYGLALAKRVKAAGMDVLVDLHYSDTWADPGKQAIPSSWPTDLAGLKTQIHKYTKNLVKAFTAQGTPIKFIEIGNEINDGILWPTGQISVNGYSPLSQLLHSAASGVRAASSSTKIVVHLANGWDGSSVSSFYSNIFIAGQFATKDVDVMGFSFYPFYGTGATFPALQSSLQAMVDTYRKDVMVVETDWPAVCSDVALSDTAVPVSVAGQSTWVADIRNVLSAISGDHGLGIIYWEPGWVGNAGLGSACADNLLVDSSGTTRSSISMFANSM